MASKWEEEFDQKFKPGYPGMSPGEARDVKQFIKQVEQKAREDERKKAKRKYYSFMSNKGFDEDDFVF